MGNSHTTQRRKHNTFSSLSSSLLTPTRPFTPISSLYAPRDLSNNPEHPKGFGHSFERTTVHRPESEAIVANEAEHVVPAETTNPSTFQLASHTEAFAEQDQSVQAARGTALLATSSASILQRVSVSAGDPVLPPPFVNRQAGIKRSGWSLERIAMTRGHLSPVQRYATSASRASEPAVQTEVPQREPVEPATPKENTTGLPDHLKAGIESLSGLSLDDVYVHYNSSRPAEVNALAYTQGSEIHVGPGQEKHLAHEAWHVVQQKQGQVKPTLQMKGVRINDDEGLEREADAMGARANATHGSHMISTGLATHALSISHEEPLIMRQEDGQQELRSLQRTSESPLILQRKLRIGLEKEDKKGDARLKAWISQLNELYRLGSRRSDDLVFQEQEDDPRFPDRFIQVTEPTPSQRSNSVGAHLLRGIIDHNQTTTLWPGQDTNDAAVENVESHENNQGSDTRVRLKDGSNTIELAHELIHISHFNEPEPMSSARRAQEYTWTNPDTKEVVKEDSEEEARTVGIGGYDVFIASNQYIDLTENILRKIMGIEKRKSYTDTDYEIKPEIGEYYKKEHQMRWETYEKETKEIDEAIDRADEERKKNIPIKRASAEQQLRKGKESQAGPSTGVRDFIKRKREEQKRKKTEDDDSNL